MKIMNVQYVVVVIPKKMVYHWIFWDLAGSILSRLLCKCS